MPADREVIVGRIETLALDAIVNPANPTLSPGDGADLAIRTAAGPDLGALLDKAGGLADGAALATPGFQLPARWVVHTVAPVWRGGDERERRALLAQCYKSCIESAADLSLRSIAFPAIGAGACGWPIEAAAEIAALATADALPRFPVIRHVVFCCFTSPDAAAYRAALAI